MQNLSEPFAGYPPLGVRAIHTHAERRGMSTYRAPHDGHAQRPTRFVCDASIVSQTWPSKSNKAAQAWLAQAGSGCLFAPAIVLEVIEQGIAPERFFEPAHAEELTQWKCSLGERGFAFLLPLRQVISIVDEMMDVRSLKNLWLTAPNARREKIPHEIYVAATAIAYRMKIATLSTKRYLSIVEAGFRLPGFITPETHAWDTSGAAPAALRPGLSDITLH
jgi:predicted nucleic acid-binding protein